MKNYILYIALGFLPFTSMMSQEFKFHSISPFGIEPTVDSAKVGLKYMFTDFDRDSDLDLIIMGYDSIVSGASFSYRSIFYFVDYQENIGDQKHPQFAPRTRLLQNFPFVKGLFFPTVGDLDGDGRIDMVVSAEIDDIDAQHILYYHQNPDGSFNVQRMNSLGIDPLLSASFFIPELTDLDHDGDLDLLMTGYSPEFFDTTGESSVPSFRYAKNIGNALNPQFLGWFENPFGLKVDPVPSLSVTGDLDLDGDVDILSLSTIDSISRFYYYKNTPGANGKPAYQSPVESPYGLPKPVINDIFLVPTLADLDGDDDLDLFVYRFDSLGNGSLLYYENSLTVSSITPAIDYSNQFTIIPNPAKAELTILNTSPQRLVEICIYTNAAKLIRVVRDHLEQPLAVNDLPNGLYILRIRLSNGQYVIKKVVVMHE